MRRCKKNKKQQHIKAIFLGLGMYVLGLMPWINIHNLGVGLLFCGLSLWSMWIYREQYFTWKRGTSGQACCASSRLWWGLSWPACLLIWVNVHSFPLVLLRGINSVCLLTFVKTLWGKRADLSVRVLVAFSMVLLWWHAFLVYLNGAAMAHCLHLCCIPMTLGVLQWLELFKDSIRNDYKPDADAQLATFKVKTTRNGESIDIALADMQKGDQYVWGPEASHFLIPHQCKIIEVLGAHVGTLSMRTVADKQGAEEVKYQKGQTLPYASQWSNTAKCRPNTGEGIKVEVEKCIAMQRKPSLREDQYFALVLLGIALAVGSYWYMQTGIAAALFHIETILLVACPCSIALRETLCWILYKKLNTLDANNQIETNERQQHAWPNWISDLAWGRARVVWDYNGTLSEIISNEGVKTAFLGLFNDIVWFRKLCCLGLGFLAIIAPLAVGLKMILLGILAIACFSTMQHTILTGSADLGGQTFENTGLSMEVYAKQTPLQKADKLEAWSKNQRTIWFCNGPNDALACQKADSAIMFLNKTHSLRPNAADPTIPEESYQSALAFSKSEAGVIIPWQLLASNPEEFSRPLLLTLRAYVAMTLLAVIFLLWAIPAAAGCFAHSITPMFAPIIMSSFSMFLMGCLHVFAGRLQGMQFGRVLQQKDPVKGGFAEKRDAAATSCCCARNPLPILLTKGVKLA
jgi:hypothetical protein